MEQLYSIASRRILQNKKELEVALKVKITSRNGILEISGTPEDEFLALEVIEAINLGFTTKEALEIKNLENTFANINIKDATRRKDLVHIRARLIGTRGKVLSHIGNLTECKLALHDNLIGIIGKIEDVDIATQGIRKLTNGSTHSKVYTFIERRYSERGL